MPKDSSIDVDAPEWLGPFVRPCYVAVGTLRRDYPPDDFSRTAIAGGGGWIYVQEGSFIVRQGRLETRVHAGESLLFTNPTRAVLVYPERIRRMRVGFYGVESSQLLETIIQRYGSFHRLASDSSFPAETEALHALGKKKRIRSAHEWSVIYYRWLMNLCREMELGVEVLHGSRQVVRNSRLLGPEHSSFKAYAREVGYHPGYLSRAIKKSWGNKSPARILRMARLHEAEQLLATTNLPVSEVARKVSYATAESFSTAFKSAYGLSPLKYRHRSRLR